MCFSFASSYRAASAATTPTSTHMGSSALLKFDVASENARSSVVLANMKRRTNPTSREDETVNEQQPAAVQANDFKNEIIDL